MGAKATTYAELIEKANPGFQYLAIFTVGERVTTWTATGGLYANTWQADVEQRPLVHNERVVSAVTFGKQDGNDATATALTPVTSIALVDATDDSWFFDPTTSIVYVRLASAADPNDQNGFIVFPLRFCTADPWTAGKTFQDTFTGNVYYPLICATPNTDKKIDGSGFAPAINTGGGTVALDSSDGSLDYVWDKYVWNCGNVVVLHGGDDCPLAEYETVFMGSIDEPIWNDRAIEFACLDGIDPLNTPIYGDRLAATDFTTTATYTGDGTRGYGDTSAAGSNVPSFTIYATGGTVAAAGGACVQQATLSTPKPMVFGKQRGVPGLVLSTYEGATYQTAIVSISDRAYKAVSAVYIGRSAAGVSWWTATNGNIAVMLTVAASTKKLSDGILFDFDATELSPGVLMTNPADIVEAITSRSYSDAVTKNALVSMLDYTTSVLYSGSYGTPPAGAAAAWAALADVSCSPQTHAYAYTGESTPRYWGYAPIPIGSLRPLTNGTYTDYLAQAWAIDPKANHHRVLVSPGNYWYFINAIICVGDSVDSVSGIKNNGSATNITYKINADNGTVLVYLWAPTVNTVPTQDFINFSVLPLVSLITASFTAANSPNTVAQPAGPIVSIDTDALDASRTLLSGMEFKFAIRSQVLLRDALVALCRDSLSYVFVSNPGLVRFVAYEPTTADEVDLDEALGDFKVSPIVRNPSERCYRKINVEYGFDGRFEDANSGSFSQTSYCDASAVGLLVGRNVDWPVAGSLHHTEASALILARRLAWLYALGAPTYTIRTTPRHFRLDLLKRVRLLRARLPLADGDGYAHCWVNRVRRIRSSNEVELELTENKIADRLGSW